MADKPTLVVPAKDEPGYWNRDLAVGLATGSLLSTFLPVIAAPVLFLGGGAIGSYLGKRRMENEQKNGKIVTEPTLLNKSMVVGAWIGQMVSVIAAIGVGALAALGTLATAVATGASPESASLFTALAGTTGAIAGAVGSIAVGALIGGKMGKSRMEKEYTEAEITIARSQEKSRGLSQVQGYTVTPELAAELEAKLNAAREKPKAPGIAAEPDLPVVRA